MSLLCPNSQRPNVLLDTINAAMTTALTSIQEATVETCEEFLKLLISKFSLTTLRSLTWRPDHEPSDQLLYSALLRQFEPESLSYLTDLILHMRFTTSVLFHLVLNMQFYTILDQSQNYLSFKGFREGNFIVDFLIVNQEQNFWTFPVSL